MEDRIHCPYPNRKRKGLQIQCKKPKPFEYLTSLERQQPYKTFYLCKVRNAVMNCSQWKRLCDKILTGRSVGAQMVSSDGWRALLALISSVHYIQHIWYTQKNPSDPPIHPPTCPPTARLRGLDKGDSGSVEPAETRGNDLAHHVSHLSPVRLLLLCCPLLRGHIKGSVHPNHVDCPVWVMDPCVWKLIRPQNTAQRFVMLWYRIYCSGELSQC